MAGNHNSGRPSGTNPKIHKTIRIKESTLLTVNELSVRLDISETEIIQTAIDNYTRVLAPMARTKQRKA